MPIAFLPIAITDSSLVCTAAFSVRKRSLLVLDDILCIHQIGRYGDI